MAGWFDVALEEQLSQGQAKLFEMDNIMVAVFALDGQYYAIEDVCSHDGSAMLGCGLPQDKVIDGNEIVCPRHGARFCIKTGDALTPPACKPIRTFPVRVRDGRIQITDDRL